MAEWSIRALETYTEIEQVEQLQRIVWPGSETDIVPAHVLITAAHNGGLVLGAYAGKLLIGLLFGFCGLVRLDGAWRPKHCSHQMGIHPEYRNLGIGFALKRAQAQIVREQGIDLITWTYDPLLAANAHLNVARLGAICDTYLREAYGEMRDGLNAGLASDRFQVDWWIDTRHVQQHLQPSPRITAESGKMARVSARPLYTLSPVPDADLIRPPTKLRLPDRDGLLAEIPPDFPKLKRMDGALARDWRAFTREMFEACFKAGYQIRGFISQEARQGRRSSYLLLRAKGKPD